MVDKNGGAAFPQSHYQRVGEMDQLKQDSGMTLRDYFAAAVLQGLLANQPLQAGIVKRQGPPNQGKSNQEWHADTAYQFADAMLERRALS